MYKSVKYIGLPYGAKVLYSANSMVYSMSMKKLDMKISLPIVVFREGTSYVAYSPVLDLSTSAKTYKKAQERFSEAVNIFFDELVLLGTVDEVLSYSAR